MKYMRMILWAMITLLVGVEAMGQSASLYLAQPRQVISEDNKFVNPYMQGGSYAAVLIPEPREFMVHDLVTVIVRESSSAKLESSLDTSKEVEVSGEMDSMIDLYQLLTNLRLVPDDLAQGNPGVGVNFDNEFTGEGEYERSDELITRLTAQVVDIKPNGLLVLEARTHIENDEEQQTITVSGYCRAEDVTADNTVLSTQMYDLRVSKSHKGEVKRASSKGLLTKLMDLIFNF